MAPRAFILIGAVLAGCAHSPYMQPKRAAEIDPRAVIAAVDPMVTVAPLPTDVLARELGGHLVRVVDPAWVIACATAEPAGVSVDAAVTSRGEALFALPLRTEPLAMLTHESYPRGASHSRLRTADLPWPVHVLTAGVLTVLTLRVERTYSPPTDEQVRVAVPRALHLAAVLERLCAGGRPLVIRRPPEGTPLELVLAASTGEASARAVLPLENEGALEYRIAAAGTRVRLAAVPGVTIAAHRQDAVNRRCDEPWRISVSLGGCANLAYSKWPGNELSHYGLVLPEPPPALGTPQSSLKARPWWEGADFYAPSPPSGRLDASLPVGETATGALLSCSLDALRVPGDDTDHVFANVRIGKRSWRTSAHRPILPLLTLAPAATIQIALYDWDYLSGDDHLATLTLKRRGAEMSAAIGAENRNRHVAMSCRVYDRPAVEAAFADAWYRAADALDAIAEAPIQVRPETSDFGFSDAGLQRARTRVSEAAGLVGWDNPRVAALLARIDVTEQRFWRGVRQSIERLSPAPAPYEDRIVLHKPEADALRVLFAESRCTPICQVEVTVENPRERTMYSSDLRDSRVLLSDGRAVEVEARGGGELAPGARAVVTLTPKGTLPPASVGATPWRLVVRGFRRLEILPLR